MRCGSWAWRVTTSPRSAPPATTFRSHAYGYSLTVPVGLTPRQAFAKWDGKSELDGDSAYVDLIGDPAESRGVWVAATPWKQDLAAFTAYIYLLNTVRPALATSYAYVNPPIAVLLGVLFANEHFGWMEAAAMVVIIAGVAVILANRK